MTDLSQVRRQAWKTRRKVYGQKGHAGAYSRGPAVACQHCTAAIALVMRLHNEGTLSEGQVSKALKLDRVTVRELADRESSSQHTSPELS